MEVALMVNDVVCGIGFAGNPEIEMRLYKLDRFGMNERVFESSSVDSSYFMLLAVMFFSFYR